MNMCVCCGEREATGRKYCDVCGPLAGISLKKVRIELNREKMNEYQKLYAAEKRAQNPEFYKKRQREYYLKNKEKDKR